MIAFGFHSRIQSGDRVDLGRGELLLYRPYDSDYQRALEAQKLEAIGCLASGIAHDFNNVLMAIVGATEGLYEDIVNAGDAFDSDTPLRTITDIMAATDRGADLARQLLSFAKRGGSSSDLVDIGFLVEEVARLVGRTFDQQIDVTTSTNTNATVVGGLSQLSQVVMNLCINARDAMPHGGKLTIAV